MPAIYRHPTALKPRTGKVPFKVSTELSLVSNKRPHNPFGRRKRRLNRGRSNQPSNLPPTNPHAHTRQNPPPERSQQGLPESRKTKLKKPMHARNFSLKPKTVKAPHSAGTGESNPTACTYIGERFQSTHNLNPDKITVKSQAPNGKIRIGVLTGR